MRPLLLASSLLLGLCLACSSTVSTSQTELPESEEAEEEASSGDDASRDRSRRSSSRRGSSENKRGASAKRPRSGSGSKSGTDKNDDGAGSSDTCCCEIQPTDAGSVRYEIVSRSSCPSQGDGGKCLSSTSMCQ